MTTDREMERVLNNPDNLILSDSLREFLTDEDPSNSEIEALILIAGKEHHAPVKKVVILKDSYIFSLKATSFSFYDMIEMPDGLILSVGDFKFRHSENSKIVWKNNHVRIETRRIINEAV